MTLQANQTTAPMEYVADLVDVLRDGTNLRKEINPAAAANAVGSELNNRLAAVLRAFPVDPIVLLSGGVDSILVAAAARAAGVSAHAITVTANFTSDEVDTARSAASALGLTHDVVVLSPDEIRNLALDAKQQLGTSEIWEIAAAVPILAVRQQLDQHRRRVGSAQFAILTGSGADAIFAGGVQLAACKQRVDSVSELDRIVRAEVFSNFRRNRLIPHFYDVLLGPMTKNLFHVFQTRRFWEYAETLAPEALFAIKDGQSHDKMPLRLECERLLPENMKHLSWKPKAPIQRSTGIFDALLLAARSYAAELPGSTTYSNPVNEPLELLAIRLYLHSEQQSDINASLTESEEDSQTRPS